jgi:hypothetical protein
MRKMKFIRSIGLVVALGILIWVTVRAQLNAHLWTISDVDISFEYSENQLVIEESQVNSTVQEFLKSQQDSAALNMDLYLLETSLNALPYVAEAQVYWNLNKTLVVEMQAIQARAKIHTDQSNYLLTLEGAVLPAPEFAQIDLPICTGLLDSLEAAESIEVLDIIEASSAFSASNIAQIHFEQDKILLTPKGANHNITANRDKRLIDDLMKLAAFYAAKSDEELAVLRHLDLRFKKQVVTTVQ